MRRLGVSVYPDYAGMDTIKAYLSSARALGFERVFTSLLLGTMGFEGAGNAPFAALGALAGFCAEIGMQLCADADRASFDALDASPGDLSVFHDLGLRAIRADGGFSPEELMRMSANPWNIRIELNASAALSVGDGGAFIQPLGKLLDKARDLGNPDNLSACHNFFPLPGTGLAVETAAGVNAVFREKGLRTGGFIASQSAAPLLYAAGHGLPTVEAHRYLPPQLAAAELFAAGFDDVIFGDFPASGEELRRVARAAAGPVDIPVVLDAYADRDLTGTLFGRAFRARADRPERMIRISDSRGLSVKPGRVGPRPAFTVTVCNARAGHYMGELQVSLCALAPSAEHNIIGFVHPDAERLLSCIGRGACEFTFSEY
jgi:hypothetical protein